MTPHVCPICQGRGLVPHGFYFAIGQPTFATNSTAPETCRACAGAGLLCTEGRSLVDHPVASGRVSASQPKHPWAEFLIARHAAIVWLLARGKTFAQITEVFRMDPEQVRLISLTPLSELAYEPRAHQRDREADA